MKKLLMIIVLGLLWCNVGFAETKRPELDKDYVSRDLLEDLLEYEEEHLDWIETQEYQIDAMGIENYLQAQVMGDD